MNAGGTVPLSEEELRLLEQMEQALAQEDPKFVSTLRGSSLERIARLRTAAAAIAFLGGVALLLGGAMARQTWLGVLGFVVMLASATIGLAAWRGRHAPARTAHPTDQIFDVDRDHRDPHRFDVIQGGRSGKGRRAPRARRQRQSRPATHGTFMQRLEQRWERRRQGER